MKISKIIRRKISIVSASVSLGVPNTEKLMKSMTGTVYFGWYISSFLLALMLVFAVAVLAASFVPFLVKEKSSKLCRCFLCDLFIESAVQRS